MTSTELETFDSQYEVPARNYSRLQWEISKLNKVCTKLKLPPIAISVVATATVRIPDTNTADGVARTRQIYTVRVVGSKPKLAGIKRKPGRFKPDTMRDLIRSVD